MKNNKLAEVRFLRAEGSNYVNSWNGLKLLVLGESHYCTPEDDCSNLSIDVMRRFVDYQAGNSEHERWMNTYTKFAKIMANVTGNNDVQRSDIISFWESVVFYNYVQTPTNGPRLSPTPDQFQKSDAAFLEVLEKYQPDLIIVWGKRLWHNLSGGEMGDQLIPDYPNDRFYNFRVGAKVIPACRISHPSSSQFNSANYLNYLRAVVRFVQEGN